MPEKPEQRQASAADIPTLVKHRRRMFEEMAAAQSRTYEPGALDRMEEAYIEYLRRHLADGSVRAWLARAKGRVVSSATVTFLPWPPVPAAGSVRVALLHSIYTLPDHRRRGHARRLVETVIAYCRARNVPWIRLGGPGTDAARSLYESLGFEPADVMRLDLSAGKK
jgi:GNAT superfamily N-acetyltransferase